MDEVVEIADHEGLGEVHLKFSVTAGKETVKISILEGQLTSDIIGQIAGGKRSELKASTREVDITLS